MKTRYAAVQIFVVISLLLPAIVWGGAPPYPHNDGNDYGCAVCHNATTNLGKASYNNVCISCHNENDPKGSSKPFSQFDAANPFNSAQSSYSGLVPAKKQQTSHSWTGSATNLAAGALTATSPSLTGSPNIRGVLICATCHDVHDARGVGQTGHFLRADADDMCRDCHRVRDTSNHLLGTHPINLTYTGSRNKASSKFFTSPINANPSNPTSQLKLVNGKLLCTTCHGMHYTDSRSGTVDDATNYQNISSSTGSLLRTDMLGKTVYDKNICTNCHNHPNHNEKENIQCADCHAGHVEYDPAAITPEEKTPNVYMLRRYVNISASSNGTSVRLPEYRRKVLFQYTAKSLIDYASSSTSICNACHKPNLDVADEHASTDTNVCKKCHEHGQPPPQSNDACGRCHGMPPVKGIWGTYTARSGGYAVLTSNRSPNRTGVNISVSYATSPYFKSEYSSAHLRHSGGNNGTDLTNYGFDCMECHYNTSGSRRYFGTNHRKGTFQNVFLDLSGAGKPVSAATEPQSMDGSLKGRPAYNPNGKGTCSNVYCHSNGDPRPSQSRYSSFSPKWVGLNTNKKNIGCNSCHRFGNNLNTNAHSKHINTVSGRGLSCAMCHYDTVGFGNATTIIQTKRTATSPSTSKHVDGVKSITFAPGTPADTTAWDSTAGMCSASYCHSDGTGNPTGQMTADWTTKFSGTCIECHGGDASSSAAINTGRHSEHIDNPNFVGAGFRCGTCHSLTTNASNNRNIINQSRHVNGKVEFTYGGYTTLGAVKSCNTVYCHSNGATGTAVTYEAPPLWTQGAANFRCNSCHGTGHDQIDQFKAGDNSFGYPSYENHTSLTGRRNSHAAHVGNTATACYTCHNRTVDATGAAIFANATTHANGRREVGFVTAKAGTAATYTTSTQTCSNIKCHGGGTIKWGAVLPSDCTGCHGFDSTSASPINTGKHTQHINNRSVLGENFGCIDCHSATIISGMAVNTERHTDGFADYTGLKAGVKIGPNGGCQSNYCHSTGQSINTFISMTSSAKNWKTANTRDCAGCHGAYTGAGSFASLYGGPNYNNVSSSTREKFNSHNAKHIGSAADCYTCHTQTLGKKTNSFATISTSSTGMKHIDGNRDVVFDTAPNRAGSNSPAYDNLAKRCSNVYCHSNGYRSGVITYQNPRWGGASSSLDCGYCHPFGALSLGHSKHVDLNNKAVFYSYTANKSSSSVYAFGCSNCHPVSASQFHMDGTVQVTLATNESGIGSLRTKNIATTAVGVGTAGSGIGGTSGSNVFCTTSYCHSNGMAGSSFHAYTSPNWYADFSLSGKDRCAMCHGNSPNSGGKSGSPAHYNSNAMGASVVGGHFVGIHYDNTYAGTGLNGLNSNAHGNATYSSTISCDTCHYTVINTSANDKNVVCSSCHSNKGSASITNKTLHVNGSVNVDFNPIRIKTMAQLKDASLPNKWTRVGTYKTGGSYDRAFGSMTTSTIWISGTKTCQNLACHNGIAVKWTDTATEGSASAVSCQSCHQSL